jgi:2-polyprenyl-3-methyl-5-hydroxy-6-metoxy-1,4-benzoquinol methylase
MPGTATAHRTTQQVWEHYTVEKELAHRLRTASKDKRRSLYGEVYDEFIQRVAPAATDRDVWAAAVTPQARLLKRFIGPETVLLEVGAGDGALAMYLADQVQKVYAIDVAEYPVHGGRRPANFEFYLFDGIDVGVPKNTVTLAYSNQVMEHLHAEDALDQLLSIYEALVRGGKYICITPNRLSGPHDVSKYFDSVATGLHLKEYTITELADLFNAVGFSKTEVVLTYKGYRLSPILPVGPFKVLEAVLEKLPTPVRRLAGPLLTAVKPVAVK